MSDMELTERQRHLMDAADGWRQYADTDIPRELAATCVRAAIALEKEAADGLARCACCHKPLSGPGSILAGRR